MSGRGAIRILSLIEWLATRVEPVSLTDAAQALDMPKSSCLGLLRALVDLGYVELTDPTHYCLVKLPGEYVAGTEAHGTLLRRLAPVVEEAVDVSGESAFIAVLEPNFNVRYLNKLSPQREIRYDRDITIPRQANQVSSGLVLLTGTTQDALAEYADRAEIAGGTSPSGEALIAEVTTTRHRGYATTRQGVVEGAAGVSAPIFDRNGTVVAALNIAGPALRMSRDMDGFVRHVVALAEKASQALGAPARSNPQEKQT